MVLYVGEEGCPYCAVMRWSLVVALMRFGTFANLVYMTPSYDGTDFPTFTFYGITYQSSYISFAGYETLDRGSAGLQALPANYSAIFHSYGQGVPFTDFGGKYYAPGALIPSSSATVGALDSLFGSKDWTEVISSIDSGDQLGSVIKAGANVITATICKLTGGAPASVCSQSPIDQLGPIAQALGVVGIVPEFVAVSPEPYNR